VAIGLFYNFHYHDYNYPEGLL